VKRGTPEEVFQDVAWLQEKQLGVPTAAEFAQRLIAKGITFESLPLTAEALADALLAQGGLAHDE
jgi:energy-coupling factor transport system ATP-binding protein